MENHIKKVLLCLALSLLLTQAFSTVANAYSITGATEGTAVNTENTEKNNIDEVIAVFNHGNSRLNLTQADIDLMAKLVYAESRGEPFEGKVAVASVVLNRVLNPKFPNNVHDVIFQPKAFSCVVNGNIVAYPDDNCYAAVYEAVKGWDPTNEALFFYNPEISTCTWMSRTAKVDSTTIGHHLFFKA